MKEDDILKEMCENFEESTSRSSENRVNGVHAVNFKNGEQWDPDVKRERDIQKRPHLVFNKIPKYIANVAGNERKNTPSMKCRPASAQASAETALAIDDTLKHIEYISDANTVRSVAYEGALTTGFHYYRVTHERTDDDKWDQDIYIRMIRNGFSVYMDESSMDYTYESGMYAFIAAEMSKKILKKKHPNIIGFDKGAVGDQRWIGEKNIRCAEYFWKERDTKKIAILSDGSVVELDGNLTPQAINQSKSMGTAKLQVHHTEEVPFNQVWYCKVAGGKEFIEQPRKWIGKYIPIIPVLGPEIYVDRKRIFISLCRWGQDAQVMYNYIRTAITEQTGLQPKTPFIVEDGQIEGYETEWRQMNTGNKTFIRYRNTGAPLPQRQMPPQVSSALVSELEITNRDFEDTIGIGAAALGLQSNDRSALQIDKRINAADNGIFQFPDNLAKSIRYEFKIVLDMLPKIYDTERIIRIIGDDGKHRQTTLNQEVMGPKGLEIINDLSVGRYDVVGDVGPSFATSKMEAATAYKEMMQYVKNEIVQLEMLRQVALNSGFPGSQALVDKIDQITAPPPPKPPSLEDQKMASVVQGHQLNNAKKIHELALENITVSPSTQGNAPQNIAQP